MERCPSVWEQGEGVAVSRAHDGEVSAIERGEGRRAEPLAGGDDRGVNDAERQIRVLAEQLIYPSPIRWLDRLDKKLVIA